MPDTISEAIPTECAQILSQMWDYLDGRMSAESAAAVQAHIAVCPLCRDYESFQARIREAEASLRSRAAAPARLRARILDALTKNV